MSKTQDYLASIQEKLNRQNKASRKGDKKLLQWKPDPNQEKQYIRLLPYKEWPDPFIELHFHYGVGKYNVLCPEQTVYIGTDCPVCAYANELRKTDWEAFRKIQAKLRVYVPVVERGKEFDQEGKPQVKFWGISKTTYMELLNTCADPDYGAIWDPETGTDLIIIYTAPDPKSGKQFGATSAKPRRNPSPLMQDADEAQAIIDAVPDWNTLYDSEEYESIESKLSEWLNNVQEEVSGDDEEDLGEHTTDSDETTEPSSSDEDDILVDAPAPKKPKSTTVKKKSVSIDEIESRLKSTLDGIDKKASKKK